MSHTLRHPVLMKWPYPLCCLLGTCTPLRAPNVYMDVHSQMKHFLKLFPEGAGKLDKMQVQSHHASRIKLGLGSPVQYLAPTVDRCLHSVAYKVDLCRHTGLSCPDPNGLHGNGGIHKSPRGDLLAPDSDSLLCCLFRSCSILEHVLFLQGMKASYSEVSEDLGHI